MSRDDELEPILRPWMRRNTADAPPDLLLRVMREVDHMSDAERTRSRSWLSLFSASFATGWVLATAVVAVMAVAGGIFLANLPPAPAPASPTPTRTPLVTTAPTGTSLVDRLVATWNSGDGAATKALYASNGEVRMAVESGSWTERYVGRDAISRTVFERVPYRFTVSRTGEALEQDEHLLAIPFTWTGSNGNGQGICVYSVAWDRLVVRQYCFGESVPRPSTQSTTPSAAIRALIANSVALETEADQTPGLAAKAEQLFAPGAEWRWSLEDDLGDQWLDAQVGYVSIAAEWRFDAGWGTSVSYTGPVIQQGSFVAYGLNVIEGDRTDKAIAVLRVNADNQIEYGWVIESRRY